MFTSSTPLIAFAGVNRIAAGPPLEVAVRSAAWLAADASAQVLIFNAETGHQAELDLRGSAAEVEQRLAQQLQGAASVQGPGEEARAGKGRPKLGVVAREVTLLPRHWEWLAAQRGGASVTLRKLVEQAARQNPDQETRRGRTEAAYRFMVALAGNEVGFEEAARALFAGDFAMLQAVITTWPADVRDHIFSMLGGMNPEPHNS